MLIDDPTTSTGDDVILAIERRLQMALLGGNTLRTPSELRAAMGTPLTGSGPSPQIVNGTVVEGSPKQVIPFGALDDPNSTFDMHPSGWMFTPGAQVA